MSAEVRIDDDFELSVSEEGAKFRTLYVRVLPTGESPLPDRPPHEWRDRAVNGCVDSQVAWAQKLLNGDGIARDPEAASRWLHMAARRDHTDALNLLGRCYEFGWGVPADGHEALRYYTRAADKGHAWAEFNLACHFVQGRFVAPDSSKALSLLVRSARRGNPKAMNMIGRYREGSDSARRRNRSAPLWYRWAAERGCFRGEFHYGRHLVAVGRISDGIRWFCTSLSHAPQDFRDDAVAYLSAHPLSQLRELVVGIGKAEQGAMP